MIIAPCCGQDADYCECPDFKRDRAIRLAIAEQDCPPAPKMAADDPRRQEDPPF